MTSRRRTAWCALWLLVLIPVIAGAAPGAATVRTYKKVIRTYPFSDPNPIPVVARIYPYFRFDGYTDTPVNKEWTVVELENDYLRVTVFPEIGGKIWLPTVTVTGPVPGTVRNHTVCELRTIEGISGVYRVELT